MSKIAVVGMGYVGLVGAVCLASMGHTVVGTDIDESRIAQLREGKLPIVEPNLDRLFSESANRLSFSTDTAAAVKESDICCVCVGTPSSPDGRVELGYVESSARQVGEGLREKNGYSVVVYRSTIPPGTSYSLILPIIESVSGKKRGEDFGYSFNPEFLREGNAIDDFFHPARTVIGSEDERVRDVLFELYRTVDGKKVHLPIVESEIIKYVDNAWHAIKVAFANEVGYFSKMHGADGRVVMDVFCMDNKLNLSPYYLKPGFAFGGSCLPKDVKAFVSITKQEGVDVPLVSSIMPSNESHIKKAARMIIDATPAGEELVIVGVSFKPLTDDIREAPSIYLARELQGRGYRILYYDPVVRADDVRRYFGEGFVKLRDEDFLDNLDDVFRRMYLVFSGSFRDAPLDVDLYRDKWVFDLNGLFYEHKEIRSESHYYGMCW